jgi:hypothetical protein
VTNVSRLWRRAGGSIARLFIDKLQPLEIEEKFSRLQRSADRSVHRAIFASIKTKLTSRTARLGFARALCLQRVESRTFCMLAALEQKPSQNCCEIVALKIFRRRAKRVEEISAIALSHVAPAPRRGIFSMRALDWKRRTTPAIDGLHARA